MNRTRYHILETLYNFSVSNPTKYMSNLQLENSTSFGNCSLNIDQHIDLLKQHKVIETKINENNELFTKMTLEGIMYYEEKVNPQYSFSEFGSQNYYYE